VQAEAARARDADCVAAFVVFEGHVQRLMDIAPHKFTVMYNINDAAPVPTSLWRHLSLSRPHAGDV
jgi:hypothetical protein